MLQVDVVVSLTKYFHRAHPYQSNRKCDQHDLHFALTLPRQSEIISKMAWNRQDDRR